MRGIAAIAGLVLLLSACGEGRPRLQVFAAASLTDVFTALSPDHTFNFAGSDQLATQIREGAEADVYASAAPRYATELYDDGLVDEPVTFATNRVVIVVPDDNPGDISSWEDLRANGIKIVVGAAGVPVGDYTRSILSDLDALDIYDNVVSEEQDVRGVVGKVVLGEADAGFCYITDVAEVRDKVRVIELPGNAQPVVEYEIAIVSSSNDKAAAGAFLDLVLGDKGRAALADAGFGVP